MIIIRTACQTNQPHYVCCPGPLVNHRYMFNLCFFNNQIVKHTFMFLFKNVNISCITHSR